MRNSALRKVRELPPAAREAVENLLGRPLEEEETVSVQAFPTHPAPVGEARAKAYRRLMERIEKTTARVNEVPEDQLDALIDEAVEYARRQR